MTYLADVPECVVSGRTKRNGLHTLRLRNWTARTPGTIANLAAYGR